MDDARYDTLVRRLDGLQERANDRLDRLEERLRLLERHTAAVLEQISALRRGLDEALEDFADDAVGMDEDPGDDPDDSPIDADDGPAEEEGDSPAPVHLLH
ncbi:hypothetical protein [Azospirillum halopraeferens]|uniref:hypothetical protein n=1 Tax=Azospirillum halopraeferens TaxID=34010 RepID=UPI0004116EEE|nr:hypothetical protein [Azospirillum halopraeferens]